MSKIRQCITPEVRITQDVHYVWERNPVSGHEYRSISKSYIKPGYVVCGDRFKTLKAATAAAEASLSLYQRLHEMFPESYNAPIKNF